MERHTGDRATDPNAVDSKQRTVTKSVEEELVSGENTPREATVYHNIDERYASGAIHDDAVSARNSVRTTTLSAQSDMCQRMELPLRPSTLASNYDNDDNVNDDNKDEGYGAEDSHDDASTSTSIDPDDFEDRFQLYRYGHTYRCSIKKDIIHPYPDEKVQSEGKRQHELHILIKKILGGANFRSPISSNARKITDMTADTEFWANAVGDDFQGAEILGLGLRSMQAYEFSPNVIIRISPGKPRVEGSDLDFLFARDAEYETSFIDEAWQHLKPGGWIELQKLILRPPDGKADETPNIVNWGKYLDTARETRGNSAGSVKSLMKQMSDRGYTDITLEHYDVPLNLLSKDAGRRKLGKHGQAAITDELWPLSAVPLMRDLNWSYKEVSSFLRDVREEMLTKDTALSLAILYGCRPPKRRHELIS